MANQYTSILVAVDGSKESEFAFLKALDVAKRNVGARLTIANIIDTHQLEAFDRSIFDVVDGQAKELLTSYEEQAKAAGLENVEIAAEYGAPKVVIPGSLAKEVKADLIICGATGRGRLERFMMGSVSQEIVRSAKCDVLVIRTDIGE